MEVAKSLYHAHQGYLYYTTIVEDCQEGNAQRLPQRCETFCNHRVA